MGSPLDQVTYDNGPQYIIWKSYDGNYENMVVTFPFDHADYEFSGDVLDEFGNIVCTIVSTKLITGISPNFVYKVSNVISPADIHRIIPNCIFRLKWVQSLLYPKTYIRGPIEVANG